MRKRIIKVFKLDLAAEQTTELHISNSGFKKYTPTIAMMQACDVTEDTGVYTAVELSGVGVLYMWGDGDLYLMLEPDYLKTLEG